MKFRTHQLTKHGATVTAATLKLCKGMWVAAYRAHSAGWRTCCPSE